ncbi:MAG: winged helix-turn-helix transcriptional regulator [Anaerolineales bacterium]|nr:winged helix-turn-helix transcriptional regulator [Anaerolineales bacterium]
MAVNLPALREDQLHDLQRTLADGHCVAIFGLSNTGKSPFMRALAAPESQRRFDAIAGRPTAVVYIDCNRLVELSATGFYEIVVRSLLEVIEDPATSPNPPVELLQSVREYHNRITTGPAFQASLAFNNALAETCSRLDLTLVLLFDEFDEIYSVLEDRTLLNLRALKDHTHSRLVYVTATSRLLSDIRAPNDNEFAELFVGYLLPLGLLAATDARRVILNYPGSDALDEATVDVILRLAGGHFGLLSALTQAALRFAQGATDTRRLTGDLAARAECLKVWNQLRPDEQAALIHLVTAPDEGLAGPDGERLRTLGLIVDDPEGRQLFSELFAAFVRRQSALPNLSAQGVVVDEDAGEVWVDGAKVTILTDLEYKLMRLLYERRDRLTTKDMIVEAVWGGEYLDRVDDARIEKLVSRLRAKIEPDPARPRYLLTQRGRGYKLSSQPVEPSKDDL